MSGSVFTYAVMIETDRISILRDGYEITYIPFEELESAEGVASWWRQVSEKSWMTSELMKRIGRAICGHLKV